jgi:hypothetical protein
MRRILFLSASPFVLSGAIACNGLLGISPSRDAAGDDDGTSGSSGAGNASNTGGNRPGTGGSGTGGAGTGGTGEGGAGESSGGSAAGSEATGGVGGNGAMGGAGTGGGPPREFPVAEEPCATPGALACERAAGKGRLICSGGFWEKTTSCSRIEDQNALCDRRTGTCGKIACDTPGEPASENNCTTNYFMACGPDRVSVVRVDCMFECLGNERCNTPTPDQLVIDEPPDFEAGNQVWPEPLVPVCWSDGDVDGLDDERAAVRLAIDTFWGYPSGLSFTGWGSCRSDEARVELRFVDDCRGYLARVSRPGYPGPGASSSVELCKSYYGGRHDGSAPTEVDVLTYAARHVFGHVLGFVDETFDPDFAATNIMVPVIEGSNPNEIGFGYQVFRGLRASYGSKPWGSLMGPDARCLGSDAGALTSDECDGSSAQGWRAGDEGLRHGDSGECLSDSGELDTCDGSARQDVRFARVRIRDLDGQCLVASGTFPNDSALDTAPCRSTWPENQRFGIEFLESGGLRIHTTMNRCITAPESFLGFPMNVPLPGFGPCDGVRDVFDVREGTLGQRGYCLSLEARPVAFEPCIGDAPQQFWLSGPLELGTGALTLSSPGSAALSVSPLGPVPAPDQIFDFQF